MSVYRVQKTGLWRYDFWLVGVRYTRHGFETRQAASDAEHELRRELKLGRTDPWRTFRGLAEDYLTVSERVNTQEHVRAQRGILGRFRRLDGLRPRDVMRGHVEAVLNQLYRDGYAAVYINQHRAVVHSVMGYGVSAGALNRNVVKDIPRMPEDESPVQPIPTAHLKQLILAAGDDMRAMLLFVSQTACRWRETARLEWSHVFVDGDPAFCLLSSRKRRSGALKTRPQPLTQVAIDALNIQRGKHPRWVFPAPRRGQSTYYTWKYRLQVLCERCELPQYGFHQIRHWAGTTAAGMGKSRKAVADFLGHSSTAVTERYMHALSPEMWEVAARLERELGADIGGGTLGVGPIRRESK